MADGITQVDSFDDAIALMEAELGEATPSDTDGALPAPEVEPTVENDDADPIEDGTDADDPVADVDDEFDFDASDEEDDESGELVIDDPDAPRFEVKVRGQTSEVSLNELINGYQRHEDYTRSKQELADEKRAWEEKTSKAQQTNMDLWNALQEDAAGTVAYLAAQVGLVDRDAVADKMKEIEGIRFAPEAEVDRLVEERLGQALANHPDVRQAKLDKARSIMESQFSQIADRVGKPLSDKAKYKLLDFATEHRIDDLTVAFDALQARMRKSDTDREDLEKARPQRRGPTASSRRERKPSTEPPADFDEAAERAWSELEASGAV